MKNCKGDLTQQKTSIKLNTLTLDRSNVGYITLFFCLIEKNQHFNMWATIVHNN